MDYASALLALDGWQLAFVAVAAFAGSLTAGLSGMGGGMLLAVAVAPIVGIEPLVPVMTVSMLINHIARVWAFSSKTEWRPVLYVSVSALPATALGALFYASLPADTIALVIGVFVLLFVPVRRLTGEAAWRLSPAGFVGLGVVFGFISGTALGAGMLIIPALLGTGLTGAALIGTDAVIGLLVLIVKAVVSGSLAVLSVQWIVFGVIVGLFTVPGIFVARWIINNTTARVHTLLIEVVLVASGLTFVYRGLTG